MARVKTAIITKKKHKKILKRAKDIMELNIIDSDKQNKQL